MSSGYNMISLPPCTVCGQKASGFHYGANTCEPCKGFFRRCLLRKAAHKCNHSDASINNIMEGRRHPCSACRFKRCVVAGMSVNAIKTGRYTLEKRTKDIKELKKLELQNLIKSNGALLSSPEDREKDLENMIDKITQIHINSLNLTTRHLTNMYANEHNYMEQQYLENQMFGSRKPISRDEYRLIRDLTGMDIDGRDRILVEVLPTMEKRITDFIIFAQALPGFKELPLSDQMALLRGSFWDRWVLLFGSCCSDASKRTVTDPFNHTVVLSDNDFLKFSDHAKEEVMNYQWKLVSRLQDLDLTESETIVAAALCFMNGDAVLSPVASTIVSASVDYLLETLDYLIKKNHEPEERTLVRLIDLIYSLRILHGFYKECFYNFIDDGLDFGQDVPQIAVELFHTPEHNKWFRSPMYEL